MIQPGEDYMAAYNAAVAEGYSGVTVINGELCGLYPFLFTHAIVVGITTIGYSHRFCYPSLQAARGAYADWIVEGGDEPKGYIKRKGD